MSMSRLLEMMLHLAMVMPSFLPMMPSFLPVMLCELLVMSSSSLMMPMEGTMMGSLNDKPFRIKPIEILSNPKILTSQWFPERL